MMTTVTKNVSTPGVRTNNPDVTSGLKRVGVMGIRKMVEISPGDRPPVLMMVTFDLFTDLSSADGELSMSRDTEAADRTLEALISRPVRRVEDLCIDISRQMLAEQDNATRTEVRMRGDFLVKKRSPVTGLECQAVYDIYADAVCGRDGVARKTLGAKVTAMTACPCAQEIFRGIAFGKLKKLGISDAVAVEFLDEMPMPTHNQRGIGTIRIGTGEGAHACLDTIIDIVENAMSSPVYGLLKREDEKHVVERAHRNPKFVEDCVRAMASDLVQRLPDLPDDAMITINQVNEESIHQHNAFAELTTIFSDLKKEVLSNGQIAK